MGTPRRAVRHFGDASRVGDVAAVVVWSPRARARSESIRSTRGVRAARLARGRQRRRLASDVCGDWRRRREDLRRVPVVVIYFGFTFEEAPLLSRSRRREFFLRNSCHLRARCGRHCLTTGKLLLFVGSRSIERL